MKYISVIIPHHNSWQKLNELLNTIPLNDDIEVIVIDDNSEDQENKLSEFSTKYPNFIFKKNYSKNIGAGAARNVGLSYATGEWVIFADADDLFMENFYTSVKNKLNDPYDIIYFTPTSFIDGTDKISRRHIIYKELVSGYIFNPSKTTELNLRYNFHVPWSKMIKRNIIVENKLLFEEIMYSNDILFSAKIGYFASSIKGSEEIIYSVRESTSSLTSTMDDKKFKIRFNAWIDFVNFLYRKLDNQEIKLLRISAIPQILQIRKNNLGIKSFSYIIRKSIKNKIPLVNPNQVIEKIGSLTNKVSKRK